MAFWIRCLCIALILSLWYSSVSAEEIWRIASLNWEPYSGASLTNEGSSIQKLREILNKEGIRLIVEFYPWKRAQIVATGKDYVGYFPAWPEEIIEGFIASPPIDWSELAIMKRKGFPLSYSDIDDLFKKYTVGVVKTYVYPKIIDNAIKRYPNHTDGAPNEISLLKKLSLERDTVAITDPSVMTYLAQKNGIDNIEIVEIIMRQELIMVLRNDADNAKRIETLNRLLKKTFVNRFSDDPR